MRERSDGTIARRLSVLFVCSTAILLTVLVSSTYWLLDREFRNDEDRVLGDTVTLLQAIFSRNDNLLETLRRDLPLDLQSFHFNRYQLRILDEQGTMLFATQRFPDLGREFVETLPTYAANDDQNGRVWTNGFQSFLVVAATAPRERASRQRVRLLVALDTSQKTRTLRTYRHFLVVIVLLGVSVSALLSTLISRRGLRPLRTMTRMVQNLRADKLETRFSKRRWPRELMPLAQQFDRLLDEVAHGMQKLSHFSTDLAHELRTPLTSLMVEAEVTLSQPRTPEEYREVLASALEEMEKLKQLVERLLLLARTEAAQRKLDLQPVQVRPLVERLLDYHFPEDSPNLPEVYVPEQATVTGDERLLELSLGNLLSNAVKYGKPPFAIRWREELDHWVLAVSDHGPGIAPEHLPFVFDRLYRADSSRQQEGGGHGLGLALVRSAMEAQAGEVTVRSEAGGGTVFELHFPRTTS